MSRPIFLRGPKRVPPRPPDPRSPATIFKRLKLSHSSTSSDTIRTCLTALYQSADAFPPLKSVSGSVLAIWDTVNRIKNCRKSARALAMRCVEILNVIADSVHDPSALSSEMQTSIAKFNDLLTDIRMTLEQMRKQKWITRFVKLDRNEDILSTLDHRVGELYSDLNTLANLQTHCLVVDTSKLLQTASKQIEILDAKSERRLEILVTGNLLL
ncbi:hypothetical protein E4T56_gene9296 [Termitomyces sp. T112]|nr:hypothetical protein E4T56_gene9296 [Termitomyces sp. T112]